ncbi:Gfo/Idh/MocA family protein [Lentiprolixibacter aurantiacus]|uniref:Gfo/Idh/MocA family oxidoreductase n=1 Tax=Lentiprolixibacter aurantiacus TaxID=2993939 RepID=A0AAE3MLD5_9FLAO|nr:Gfo/Idh/MocA family oxidoreductase [Lentiprolixibacter aurantiacus]MCX2719451.1 Gfo/Idh/MocA family oxidoreductase [Lentiprolixibacter aurantiacus]
MSTEIRWGIVGLGKIADTFARDLALVPEAALTAVASRGLKKAEAFKEKHKAVYALGSYEELFNCPEVDVIYIATPHSHHAPLALRAMECGKHVLCEKPMGVNREQSSTMLNMAREKKVFFMEALWSRFMPAIVRAKELVDSGALGEVRYIHADFAFYALDRDPEGRLLNPELAGGSLLDIGIYPVFLSYMLLGKPEKVHGVSRFHQTGAEIETSMIFEYDGAQALLFSGLTCNSEMKAMICGTKGTIYVHPRWHESQELTLQLGDEVHSLPLPKLGKGYVHEINEVHNCLNKGQLQSELWSHQNSLDLIELLDLVRSQNGIRFPFE